MNYISITYPIKRMISGWIPTLFPSFSSCRPVLHHLFLLQVHLDMFQGRHLRCDKYRRTGLGITHWKGWLFADWEGLTVYMYIIIYNVHIYNKQYIYTHSNPKIVDRKVAELEIMMETQSIPQACVCSNNQLKQKRYPVGKKHVGT